MLSDVLSDAIHDIEDYQRDYPDIYDGQKDHVEAVKKVMASLRDILDEAPGSFPANLTETLSKEEQERFRGTCEAQLGAWAERLRLVNPVIAETLLTTLAGPPVRMTEPELKEKLRKALTDDERSAIKTYLFLCDNGIRFPEMYQENGIGYLLRYAPEAIVDFLNDLDEDVFNAVCAAEGTFINMMLSVLEDMIDSGEAGE